MSGLRLAAAAAALAFISVPAAAATLTVTSIEGIWSSTVPTVTGVGTSEIRWGTSTGLGRSGYDFVPSSTDLTAESDTAFALGTFTHRNLPIVGTFLDSAELTVRFTIAGLDDPIISVFSFDHWETRNESATCADGGPNGVGVNAAGCADRVTATLNAGSSQIFSIGGVNYVLDVTGFQYLGQTLSEFWTRESALNSAQLLAVFSTEVPQTPPSEIPLPAAGFLLAGALSALAVARRKR